MAPETERRVGGVSALAGKVLDVTCTQKLERPLLTLARGGGTSIRNWVLDWLVLRNGSGQLAGFFIREENLVARERGRVG